MQSSNPLILLIILIAILVTALAINYHFHQREQAKLQRQQRSRQLKKDIQQTVDSITALRGANAPAAITNRLTEHAARLINQLAEVNPAAGVVDQLRSRSDQESPAPIASGLHSVQLVQSAIRVTLSILRQQQQFGQITPLEVAEFSKELAWLHIACEADLYTTEGKKLMENGKPALAISHFKHAKTVIAKASSKEPRRNEKLQELRELLDQANPFKSAPSKPQPEQGAPGS